MRSEKEIDDMIAKLSAAESPSMSAAIMALMWVRGEDISSMLQSAIEKSTEKVRAAFYSGPDFHWPPLTITLEPVNAEAQPPHAPATPPPED